jgi:hypothetical protein
MSCQQEHLAGPIQPGGLTRGQAVRGQGRRQVHLGGHLYALASHIEQTNRLKVAAAALEPLRILFPSLAQ